MEGKKRSKRTKTNDLEDSKQPNNVDAEADFSMCSSSDFPSSQECFSVGWDWSGQKSDKPSIRVIERPVQRRNEAIELLQCQRKRQFVTRCDPDLFDASVFVDQLKSLAARFKCVPESTSPVASPPHSIRRQDLIVTPTALRKPSASSTSVESSNSATPAKTSSESLQDVKESLNDLLDDSLGADLLKCTQDYEQKQFQTPTLQEVGLSSTKRKHRLSLSSSKNCKTVCRRINDIYEKHIGTDQQTLKDPKDQNQDKQNNNKNVVAEEFGDLDEAALLATCELEETAQPTLQGGSHTVEITNAENTRGSVPEDDEFVSPDLLCMLDALEKKATQEELLVPDSSKLVSSSTDSAAGTKLPVTVQQHGPSTKKLRTEVNRHQLQKEQISSVQSKSLTVSSADRASHTILDMIDEQHENGLKNMGAEANRHKSSKKSLSLGGGPLKYTPEEIEKKRQEARKRLQLKKKQT